MVNHDIDGKVIMIYQGTIIHVLSILREYGISVEVFNDLDLWIIS